MKNVYFFVDPTAIKGGRKPTPTNSIKNAKGN